MQYDLILTYNKFNLEENLLEEKKHILEPWRNNSFGSRKSTILRRIEILGQII